MPTFMTTFMSTDVKLVEENGIGSEENLIPLLQKNSGPQNPVDDFEEDGELFPFEIIFFGLIERL